MALPNELHVPAQWLCTCKGTAALWVKAELQSLITPLATSHGAGLVRRASWHPLSPLICPVPGLMHGPTRWLWRKQ
jgi:hypothetical protein